MTKVSTPESLLSLIDPESVRRSHNSLENTVNDLRRKIPLDSILAEIEAMDSAATICATRRIHHPDSPPLTLTQQALSATMAECIDQHNLPFPMGAAAVLYSFREDMLAGLVVPIPAGNRSFAA